MYPAISQQEFEVILADETKRVIGDIRWKEVAGQRPAQAFRAEVAADWDYSLFVVGRWNPSPGKLSYSLVLRGTGRIYGLDIGVDHKNPDGEVLEEKHKNRWRQGSRDRWAYVPVDVTAGWNRPVEAWAQFCGEASLRHVGIMFPPVGS